MDSISGLFHIIIILINVIKVVVCRDSVSLYRCHAETSVAPVDVQEGPLGETNIFPWLGVLKAYIRDEGEIVVALTGVVFITHRHALANADEVAKMPPWIFENDVRAMFIPFNGHPLYYRLLNYVAHPEYNEPTINTIALVALDDEGNTFPMRPVCWSSALYQNLENLYITGFTDEYHLLEKFLYKATNEDIQVCEKFYQDEGLSEIKRDPTDYLCASTTNIKDTCIWDTGHALISNSTGYWVLVGFGVHGPGCAAPARFLHMLHYSDWIWSIVAPEYQLYRRQADDVHYDLLEDYSYQFDTEQHSYTYYEIDKTSDTEMTIRFLNQDDELGNCGVQIYREIADIAAPSDNPDEGMKSAAYKLSLYDLHYMNVTCIRIKLNANKDRDASLFVEDHIEHTEGGALTEWGDTPIDILQHYPLRNESALKPKPRAPGDWTPGANLRPESLRDMAPKTLIKNHNLYMKFTFQKQASYDIQIYSRPPPSPPILEVFNITSHLGCVANSDNKNVTSYMAIHNGNVVVPLFENPRIYRDVLRTALDYLATTTGLVNGIVYATAMGFHDTDVKQKVYHDQCYNIIEPKYIKKHIDTVGTEKRPGKQIYKGITVTATSKSLVNITQESNKITRKPKLFYNTSSENLASIVMTAKKYKQYTTTTANFTIHMLLRHETRFGKYMVASRKRRTAYRWCIFPHCHKTNMSLFFCASDLYNDDNIPQNYSHLQD